MHYVTLEASNQTLDLWVTSEEHGIGLFTDECFDCRTRNYYDLTLPSTTRETVGGSFNTNEADVFD